MIYSESIKNETLKNSFIEDYLITDDEMKLLKFYIDFFKHCFKFIYLLESEKEPSYTYVVPVVETIIILTKNEINKIQNETTNIELTNRNDDKTIYEPSNEQDKYNWSIYLPTV